MATSKPSDVVRVGGAFILVVLVLVSLLGVLMAVRDVVTYLRVPDFVEVEGRVDHTYIKEDIGTSEAYRYRPIVEFSWEVEGQRYEDSNRRIVDEMTREQAEAHNARYPKGAPITVYYDPEDVDDAVLDDDPPLLRAETLGFLIPSLGLWIYFGGWLIPAWRKKRREAKAA